MARLIDANELIEHMFLGTEYDSTVDDGMDKTEAMCKAFKCGWNDALASVMDYAPTVDAVEVVRCKDCIHKPRGTRNKHDMEFPDEICPCQCDDYWYSWMPYDDWFCANGERREDETN